MNKLKNISTSDLKAELIRRKEIANTGEHLRTPYDPIFLYDTYEVTKVITPNDTGRTPIVGQEYFGSMTDYGLVCDDDEGNLRGFYYEVEGKVVKEKDSFAEYIKNLDINDLTEIDRKYYLEYAKEFGHFPPTKTKLKKS